MRTCKDLLTGENVDFRLQNKDILASDARSHIASRLGLPVSLVDIVCISVYDKGILDDEAPLPEDCHIGIVVSEDRCEEELVHAIHPQAIKAYCFKDLKNLKCLILNGCLLGTRISTLPKRICEFRRCRKIVICDCELWSIPPTIGKMSSLHELEIKNTYLHKLPDSVGNLFVLRHLDLSNNFLEDLPESMGKLLRLELLDLSSNPLPPALPDWVGNLKNLIVLRLSHTRLHTLSSTLVTLYCLEELCLNDNYLTHLPEKISGLEVLHSLFIARNTLRELPKDFGKLPALKFLDATGNCPRWSTLCLPPGLKELRL